MSLLVLATIAHLHTTLLGSTDDVEVRHNRRRISTICRPLTPGCGILDMLALGPGVGVSGVAQQPCLLCILRRITSNAVLRNRQQAFSATSTAISAQRYWNWLTRMLYVLHVVSRLILSNCIPHCWASFRWQASTSWTAVTLNCCGLPLSVLWWCQVSHCKSCWQAPPWLPLQH